MPKSFSVGGFTFHWYGLIVGVAVVLFYELFSRLLIKRYPKISITPLIAVMLTGALIGARIYHLFTDWHLYQQANLIDLIAVWNGGIGMIGALIGGAVSVASYLFWRFPKNWRDYFIGVGDCAALALPFAQAVGRWGNYVNQELYGVETNLPWGIQVAGEAHKVHPLFLYESVLNTILGVVLWRLYRTKKLSIGTGQFLLMYGLGYAVIRFSLEFLRIDSSRINLPGLSLLSTAQWMMVLLGLSCIIILMKRIRV